MGEGENGAMVMMMNTNRDTCAHEWTYFVNVETKAIRMRQCTRCGMKRGLGVAQQNEAADVADSLKLGA
jgi:hypothetical protein